MKTLSFPVSTPGELSVSLTESLHAPTLLLLGEGEEPVAQRNNHIRNEELIGTGHEPL